MRGELAGQLETEDVVEDCRDDEDDVEASEESEESQEDDSLEEDAEVDGVELVEGVSKSEDSERSLGLFTLDKSVGATLSWVVAKCGPRGVYLT